MTILASAGAPSLGADHPAVAHAESFKLLRERVLMWNAEYEPTAWWMNSEHLFIYDEALMKDAIAFSRAPGGLDYLFDLVLSPRTGDEDLLVVAEILVYFGGHPEDGDNKIKSRQVVDVMKALADGRVTMAEKRYPRAPIGAKIRDACNKASPSKNDG
jgi:hypothetical protein